MSSNPGFDMLADRVAKTNAPDIQYKRYQRVGQFIHQENVQSRGFLNGMERLYIPGTERERASQKFPSLIDCNLISSEKTCFLALRLVWVASGAAY
jgi:hypothetical protein